MNDISKDIIEAELISGISLCINDFNYDKKEVLIINANNIALLNFISTFNINVHYVGSLDNISSNINTYSRAIELKTSKFDVIVDLDNKTTTQYASLLKSNGILIINLDDLNINKIKESNFNVKMPFKIEGKFYLFLSNRFHPLADFSSQKVDLISDFKYYNEGIHRAVFALPNYQKQALRGVIRN
ncbi:hypothetical protein [Helicobacter sp. MIT 14-3879]|uniref:hypothetical protein n=1 Tax=Helicobacter sp. MIT 14-3879 TaxID=2040649 RepID=UPI000E1F4EE3|nr:hypothetical protein [Helicobacter sp. MIT 14-3879]RDU65231.1 hypothetical protein CQA44_02660 [Helicobacter sp. MIT 14-3879]